jgi:hypothetical protein
MNGFPLKDSEGIHPGKFGPVQIGITFEPIDWMRGKGKRCGGVWPTAFFTAVLSWRIVTFSRISLILNIQPAIEECK